MRGRGRAPGFTIVEVVVALTVFGVGVVGVVATGALAARLLARAQQTEAAVRAASLVMDSLLQLRVVRPGSRTLAGRRVHWAVREDGGGTVVEVVVTASSAGRGRRIRFTARHTPAPLLLEPGR